MTTSTKSVMKLAHLLCSYGVLCYGGKHNEYLSESLKTAWAKFKERSIEPFTDKVEDAVKALKVIERNQIAAEESIQKQIEEEDAMYEDEEVVELDEKKVMSCFTTFSLSWYNKPTLKQLDESYERLIKRYAGKEDCLKLINDEYEYLVEYFKQTKDNK